LGGPFTAEKASLEGHLLLVQREVRKDLVVDSPVILKPLLHGWEKRIDRFEARQG